MPIDWFTVGAQVINFLILVALLKHFLYGPIVRAMDERRDGAVATLREAEDARAEARRMRESAERQRAEIESRREELLREARDAADLRERELTEAARERARKKQHDWERELERRRGDWLSELVDRTAGELVEAVRGTLADLAGVDLERRIIERGCQRLRELDDADRESFRAACRGQAVRVVTAFDCPEQQREAIAAALRDIGTEADSVEHETDASLTCGMEIRCAGWRVSWSVARHVDRMRDALRSALGPEGPAAADSRAGASGNGDGGEETGQEPRRAG